MNLFWLYFWLTTLILKFKPCLSSIHRLVISTQIGTFWYEIVLGGKIEFQISVYVVAVALKLQDGRHVACFAFSFALACSGTPWPNQHNEKFKYVISHEETLEESCSTLVSNSSSSFLTQLCTVIFLIIVVFTILYMK